MFRVWLHLLIILCITTALFACSDDHSEGAGETPDKIAPTNFKVNPTEKSFLLSWDAVKGAKAYSVCYATVPITSFMNCLSLSDGIYVERITDTQIEIMPTLPKQGVTYYFQISASDVSGIIGASSASISARLLALPQATGKLNDTGIIFCGNETENGLPCPVADFPNQDAEQGRDVIHNDNSDGYAGFIFTKVGRQGEQLPASASEWFCVKDQVTGLIWEVKTNDSGLHDKDWTYSWWEPDATKNGAAAGYQNQGQCGETSSCDTTGFVQKVNKTVWCGAKDWRMPTIDELFGIARLDRYQHLATDKPAIDTNYFPNTSFSVVEHNYFGAYWSSSSVAYDNGSAWVVNFVEGGSDDWNRKNDAYQVRLVRSGH